MIVVLGFATSLSAEKVCESCRLRQASHKDDLTKVGYYEDSSYFSSNFRGSAEDYSQGEDQGISWQDTNQAQQPAQQKLKKTNPYQGK